MLKLWIYSIQQQLNGVSYCKLKEFIKKKFLFELDFLLWGKLWLGSNCTFSCKEKEEGLSGKKNRFL